MVTSIATVPLTVAATVKAFLTTAMLSPINVGRRTGVNPPAPTCTGTTVVTVMMIPIVVVIRVGIVSPPPPALPAPLFPVRGNVAAIVVAA